MRARGDSSPARRPWCDADDPARTRLPRNFAAVADVITRAVDAGAFPGAVILIARGGEVLYHEAFGSRSLVPERTPMAPDTVFDLSSLTKPLATTTLVMLLIREGKLRPDDRVTRFFQNFGVHGKFDVTVRHLLAHCSGLPAWRPFYRDIARAAAGRPNLLASRGAREFVYEQIHRERLEYPTGTQAVYSDLGFMLLGRAGRAGGAGAARSLLPRAHLPAARPARRRGSSISGRLRRDKLVPVTDVIAPTEQCPWREKLLCGEVHDDNAWAMGGVAGHAGPVLDRGRRPHPGVLAAGLRAAASDSACRPSSCSASGRATARVPDSTWALGWDTPSPTGSSAGTRVARAPSATSASPARRSGSTSSATRHVILLTNRVHPDRHNERIREVRPRVHDAVWEALDA